MSENYGDAPPRSLTKQRSNLFLYVFGALIAIQSRPLHYRRTLLFIPANQQISIGIRNSGAVGVRRLTRNSVTCC